MTPTPSSTPMIQRAVRTIARWVTVTAALCASTVVAPGPAGASEGDGCAITQVTATTQANISDFGNQLNRESLSGDGTRLAFASDRDLTGENPLGQRQVFYFDAVTGETRQITGSPGGGMVIAADGSRIAYSAWDGVDSSEVYGYDPDTQVTTQLTSGDHAKDVMSISADGTRLLTFQSGRGAPNTIEVLDTTTQTAVEVAYDAGGHVSRESSALSPDGTHVAFSSRANITGDNPDASAELFVFDTTPQQLSQLTSSVTGPDSGGSTGNVQFTDNGATVLFVSNSAVLGPNPTRAFRRYRYDVASEALMLAPSVPLAPGRGMWSPNGTRYQVATTEDPTGGNPEGNPELFTYDPATGDITQLTASHSRVHGSASGTSVSSDGSTIAFRATANLTGDNRDHNDEIFLATTCDPSPRPDAKIATARSGPYTGRHTYAVNPTPAQKLKRPIRPGATRKFFLRVQNERAAADMFTLSGGHAGAPGYQVTYLDGRDDITAQVQDGNYVVGPLDPGESVTVKVKIRAVTARAGTHHVADLTARSQTNPVAADTIRAKVTRR